MQIMAHQQLSKQCAQGLLPVYFNPTSSRFTTNKVSLGAMGDSYYEYLLKVWPCQEGPLCCSEVWKGWSASIVAVPV